MAFFILKLLMTNLGLYYFLRTWQPCIIGCCCLAVFSCQLKVRQIFALEVLARPTPVKTSEGFKSTFTSFPVKFSFKLESVFFFFYFTFLKMWFCLIPTMTDSREKRNKNKNIFWSKKDSCQLFSVFTKKCFKLNSDQKILWSASDWNINFLIDKKVWNEISLIK